MTRILLLGGTTEAGAMARALAEAGIDGVYSYAGRTAAPIAQPLPLRVGGFGGPEGLARYLRAAAITHVIDATHPFATAISANAGAACHDTATPLIALERPPWRAGPGDDWRMVRDIEAAVDALPRTGARVFLAIGRQNLRAFGRAPQHHYLLRLVDPPAAALPLPDAALEIARGPFTVEGDLDLLRRHRIEWVVAKNSGGAGARAKLDAARALGLPVIVIERPAMPDRPRAETIAEVMDWLSHAAPRGL